MKKSLLSIVLLAFISSVYAQQPSIKAFNFFVGTWQMKTKDGKIVERWKKYSDSLLGYAHRFNSSGDSTLTEKMVVKEIKGTWHYCVTGYMPDNLGTTNFKLISKANNSHTFENKENNFPQQITYQNKSVDELLAWIEGEMGGKKSKIEFPYKRIK